MFNWNDTELISINSYYILQKLSKLLSYKLYFTGQTQGQLRISINDILLVYVTCDCSILSMTKFPAFLSVYLLQVMAH